MRLIYFIAALTLSIGIFSCTKSSQEIASNVSVTTSNDVLGRWEVVAFTDSGIDKTILFKLMNLQFNSGGTLLVFKNDSTIDGSWTLQGDIGLDHLVIMVGNPVMPYSFLDENWFVSGKTTSTLELINSHPARPQILTLRRI